MYQVPLQPGLPEGRWALLRELCGHDEAFVEGTGDLMATRLVERLLVEADGTSVGPRTAWDLAVCDRDRLLSAIYERCFGDRVEATVHCRDCRKFYELVFALRELRATLGPRRPVLASGPDDEGLYTLPGGRRFRLPSAGDLRGVLGLDRERARSTLLARCLVEGDPAVDVEAVEEAMAEAGPVVDLELDANCGECGQAQKVRFDIRTYLLAALAREKRWLIHEVHYLASAYGWGLREILDVPRDDRRAYVRLIAAGLSARRRTAP